MRNWGNSCLLTDRGLLYSWHHSGSGPSQAWISLKVDDDALMCWWAFSEGDDKSEFLLTVDYGSVPATGYKQVWDAWCRNISLLAHADTGPSRLTMTAFQEDIVWRQWKVLRNHFATSSSEETPRMFMLFLQCSDEFSAVDEQRYRERNERGYRVTVVDHEWLSAWVHVCKLQKLALLLSLPSKGLIFWISNIKKARHIWHNLRSFLCLHFVCT